MNKAQEKHYRHFERPPFAKIYRPTEEEFKDPLAYVAKIKPEAETYGVIKIVPPAYTLQSFQPPFAIDPSSFEFTPRVQRLNELEAISRVRLNFLNKITSFWHLQGTVLKVPVIDNKYLDLYKLHKTVNEMGGFEEVSKQKKWGQIAIKRFNLAMKHGTMLKAHYQKLLQPWDKSGLADNVHGVKQEREEAPPMAVRPPSSQSCSMTMRNRRRTVDAAVPDTISGPPKPVVRGGRMMAGVALKRQIAVPEQKVKKKTPKLNDPIADVLCGKCEGGDDEELLLLCESCDKSYHTYCLTPALPDVPKGDWRCPTCVTEAVCKLDEGYGFEQSSRGYTLRSFAETADRFKTDYFGIPLEQITTDDVEREFWRNVINFDKNVSVKYGADLFADEVGSGFPVEKNGKQLTPNEMIYARHPWNLNNLPVLRSSVLSHINVDISGMMIPWDYVGMCFSTFCWHTEDHWTYSINYLHWGERKIWYGVSGSDGDVFEDAMKTISPELFAKQPDLLHHIVTIMNPRLLMEKGVKIYTVHQNPGEFVITFPRAYHAGFNEGYNFAEAVNFAPSDWLPMGRRSVDHYSLMRRYCVFSHDELVCGMAAKAQQLDIGSSIAAYKDMLRMVEWERDRRKLLKEKGVREAERTVFETLLDENRICNVCQTACFLSALTCSCEEGKMVCLRHTDQLCNLCKPNDFVLKYRYTLDELPPLMKALLDRTKEFDTWCSRVKMVLQCNENTSYDNKPELADLKLLMEEARSSHFPSSEILNQLTVAIKHAEKCASIADKLVATKMRTRNRNQCQPSYNKKLKLSEVEQFVVQINKLPCQIAQAKPIKDFVEKVRTFCDNSRQMIERAKNESPASVMDDLRQLFDEAVSFDLHLDEAVKLKEELEKCQWFAVADRVLEAKVDMNSTTLSQSGSQANELPAKSSDSDKDSSGYDSDEGYEDKRHQVSLNRLKALISEGRELAKLVQADHGVNNRLVRLGVALERVNENDCTVTKLLESKPTVEEADKIISHLDLVQGVRETKVDEFMGNLNKARDWIKRYDSAKDTGLTMTLIDTLLSQSRLLQFDLEPRLSELRRTRINLEDFLTTVEDLFKPSPCFYSMTDMLGPRRDLAELLEGQNCPLSVRRKCVRATEWAFVDTFESTEKMCMALERMSEQETDLLVRMRQTNADETTICVCRRQLEGAKLNDDLLVCTLCNARYHSACVQWQDALGGLDGVYLCVRCLRTKRPNIHRIQSAIDKMKACQSLEANLLKQLVSRHHAWCIKCSDAMKECTGEELSAEQLNGLRKVLLSGLALEVSSDDMTNLIALYNRHTIQMPGQVTQRRLLEHLNCRPKEIAPQMDLPLFSMPGGLRRSAKRSLSPTLSSSKKDPSPARQLAAMEHKKGAKKQKTVYHHDEQSCSALNCVRPYGDNVNWVQCDSGCSQWFHLLCVGLKVTEAESLDYYSCFKCDPLAKASHLKKEEGIKVE